MGSQTLQKSMAFCSAQVASCLATISMMYSARTESMVGIKRAEKFSTCAKQKALGAASVLKASVLSHTLLREGTLGSQGYGTYQLQQSYTGRAHDESVSKTRTSTHFSWPNKHHIPVVPETHHRARPGVGFMPLLGCSAGARARVLSPRWPWELSTRRVPISSKGESCRSSQAPIRRWSDLLRRAGSRPETKKTETKTEGEDGRRRRPLGCGGGEPSCEAKGVLPKLAVPGCLSSQSRNTALGDLLAIEVQTICGREVLANLPWSERRQAASRA